MGRNNRTYFTVAILLVAFAVISRLLPHPPNFAPIAAVAIFGGAVLPKRWAVALPLLAMVASDLLIGLHPLFLLTWGSFVVIAILSHTVLTQIKPVPVVAVSLSASLLFYVVSNLGVWLEDTMYPMTLAGLADCYYQALPFLRNTVLGDLAYTSLLFTVYSWAMSGEAKQRLAMRPLFYNKL